MSEDVGHIQDFTGFPGSGCSKCGRGIRDDDDHDDGGEDDGNNDKDDDDGDDDDDDDDDDVDHVDHDENDGDDPAHRHHQHQHRHWTDNCIIHDLVHAREPQQQHGLDCKLDCWPASSMIEAPGRNYHRTSDSQCSQHYEQVTALAPSCSPGLEDCLGIECGSPYENFLYLRHSPRSLATILSS